VRRMQEMQDKCGQGLGFKAGARSGMTLFVPVASVEIQLHHYSGCQGMYSRYSVYAYSVQRGMEMSLFYLYDYCI
jgi:hypothetical protein